MLRISHVFPPLGRARRGAGWIGWVACLVGLCLAGGSIGSAAAEDSARAASRSASPASAKSVDGRSEKSSALGKPASRAKANGRTSVASAKSGKPTGKTSTQVADESEGADTTEAGESLAAVEFEAPFPHRLNPFELPDEPMSIAGKQDDKTHPDVLVLGFANVDRPKVIVEINGMVATLAVGDRFEQVEVTAIEPPSVSFEFRRLPWTLSIFDEPERPEHSPGMPSRPGTTVRAGVVRTPPAESTSADRGPTGLTRPSSRLSSPGIPSARPVVPTSTPTSTSPPAVLPATRAADTSAQAQPGSIPPRLGTPAGHNSKSTLSPSSVPEVTRRLPPSTLTDSRKP